eukprot:COSAG05_NODE_12790_length_454_cov_1.253521_1_plen_37_part_10
MCTGTCYHLTCLKRARYAAVLGSDSIDAGLDDAEEEA